MWGDLKVCSDSDAFSFLLFNNMMDISDLIQLQTCQICAPVTVLYLRVCVCVC